MNKIVIAAVIPLLILAGCATGPVYQRPISKTPDQWKEAKSTSSTENTALTAWWKMFHDPVLDQLIAKSAENNLDLQIAKTRIREARALLGVANAAGKPTLNTSADYSRSKQSESTVSSVAKNAVDLESNMFQAGFDAGWELDIFGGIKHGQEAAKADFEAAEELQRDVLLSVISETARNYVLLCGLQQERAIITKNVETQQDTLHLTQVSYQAGLTNELSTNQASALLSTTKSQLPSIDYSIQQAVHRISVLLGETPETVLEELATTHPIPQITDVVPAGLPSDIIRRRPDIRQAERALASATERIGQAQADLFPHFSLTGSFGRKSKEFDEFTFGGNQFWGIGPSVRFPLFDAGKIKANIEVQNARQERALITYQQTVIKSLEETENALSAYNTEQDRNKELRTSVESNRKAVALSTELYQKGLADFLHVLDSQRSLTTAEDQLVQSDRILVLNLISLYKALGGGWEEFFPEIANDSIAKPQEINPHKKG